MRRLLSKGTVAGLLLIGGTAVAIAKSATAQCVGPKTATSEFAFCESSNGLRAHTVVSSNKLYVWGDAAAPVPWSYGGEAFRSNGTSMCAGWAHGTTSVEVTGCSGTIVKHRAMVQVYPI
jgi:hypothetical protein